MEEWSVRIVWLCVFGRKRRRVLLVDDKREG